MVWPVHIGDGHQNNHDNQKGYNRPMVHDIADHTRLSVGRHSDPVM